MSQLAAFCLSPGITVGLTDVVVVEFAVVVGLAYVFAGPRGFELGFAANAFLLGLIKLITDYSDRSDLPVSFSGILGGFFAGVFAARQFALSFSLRTLARFGGVLFAGAGALKIITDFCDPFDVLLGALALVSGVFLWMHAARSTPHPADGAPSH